MNRLQSVQHAAERLIFSFDHTTDAFISLHWLRIPECIRYKVIVLTYTVFHGSAPQYLGTLVRVADQACPPFCWYQLLCGAICRAFPVAYVLRS
jgi:hypothetical protein